MGATAARNAKSQVSVPLTGELSAVLDAIAYLEGRSRADVAREWVEDALKSRSGEPEVVEALRLRRTIAARA